VEARAVLHLRVSGAHQLERLFVFLLPQQHCAEVVHVVDVVAVFIPNRKITVVFRFVVLLEFGVQQQPIAVVIQQQPAGIVLAAAEDLIDVVVFLQHLLKLPVVEVYESQAD